MPDSMNLGLTVNQVQCKVGLANMSDLKKPKIES
jgi:hypothetical protein